MAYMVYLAEIERNVVIAPHGDQSEDPRFRMAERAVIHERAVPIEPLISKRWQRAGEALLAARALNSQKNGLKCKLALGERRGGLHGAYAHREYRAVVVREIDVGQP
jgi:hypothetical protein